MSLNLIYKGFNYTSDYAGDWSDDDSLSSLVETGANAIATTFSFGIDPQDDQIYADSRYTDTSGEAMAIQEGVAAGLSVMVRPRIDFFNTADYALTPYAAGEWRGYFNPGEAGSAGANAFFASYEAMILQQAQIATTNGASSLCIGSELDQITGPTYKGYWDRIISALRANDPTLKLTYAADWDDDVSPWTQAYSGIATGLAGGTGNLATQVSFASELDTIGIDCYAPISNLANPTLAQLVGGWTVTPVDSGATALAYAVTGDQSLISYFESVAAAVGVPLLFTELGYENASDASGSPARTATGAEDDALQSELYQAFFDAWQQSGNSSLAGVYFWDWNPNASRVAPGAVGFSPQGLPAQSLISAEFKSGPECPRETNRAGMTSGGSSNAARGTAGTAGTGALAGVSDSGSSILTITAVRVDGVAGTVGTFFDTGYGQLQLDSDGSYTYYANDVAALAAAPMGAPTADVIDFTVTDGDGAEANSTLTIDDYRDPDAVPATGSVLAGATLAATAANGVLRGDVDPDGVELSVAAANALGAAEAGPIAGSYGTLTLNSDGSYTYVADAPPTFSSGSAAQPNSPARDVFPILVEGGGGADTLSTLTIDVSSSVFAGGGYNVDLTAIPGGKIYLDNTSGIWDNVQGSGGSVYFNGAQASVFGGDDSIYFTGGNGNQVSLYDTAGAWDSFNGSVGTIYLTNAQFSAFGGGNTIYFSGGSGNQASLYGSRGDWDYVSGSGGIVYLTDSQTSVVGGDDSIFLGASGSQVGLYNTLDKWDTVTGSHAVVKLTNAQASVFGGANTISLGGNSGNQVSLYDTSASWDWISGSNATLDLDDAQASISGGGNAIYLSNRSGDQLGLYNTRGNWDSVDGSGCAIYFEGAQSAVSGGDVAISFVGAGNQASLFATAGNWDSVQASDGTLYLTDAQASVFGGANTIDLSNAAGNQVSLFGTSSGNWDSVTGSNGTVYLTSAQASLLGGANSVYLLGTGGNEVSLRDTSGGWDAVSGSGGTVYLTNAQTSVYGGGDSIYFLGDSGDAASLYATNGKLDNVNGSDGTLYLTDAQASVFGGDEAIYLGGAGNRVNLDDTLGLDDNVSGSHATISLTSAEATVTGNSDIIQLAGGSAVAANGGSDTFVFQAAFGQEVIAGFTVADEIQFASADFANWQALSNGHILQSGDDAVITYDNGESVTLTDVSATSLVASEFRFR